MKKKALKQIVDLLKRGDDVTLTVKSRKDDHIQEIIELVKKNDLTAEFTMSNSIDEIPDAGFMRYEIRENYKETDFYIKFTTKSKKEK